eukprot:6205254-Pleurochrysis_carterae.AAC.2
MDVRHSQRTTNAAGVDLYTSHKTVESHDACNIAKSRRCSGVDNSRFTRLCSAEPCRKSAKVAYTSCFC